MGNTIYTVAQVNAYIRNMFTADYLLNRVSVRGEVSNCKYHSSGHIYFTIKDEQSSLACVMFSRDRRGLSFRLQDGDHVVVSGPVEVYMRDGRYQLYARKIEKQGAGVLYERFLALKAELEEMGMFSPEYKQPVPAHVRRLGIVTAPTGAAIQDIRNIALRHNPYVQLILFPALVQGEGAVRSIVTGIRVLDALGLDCIIVGRGGGSIEDLWAFNEEPVARAIFEAETPIISAVGHETDTTIADFAADLRAPTPSAAAELAVADIRDVLQRLQTCRSHLLTGMQHTLHDAENRLAVRSRQWKYLSPASRLREKRQRAADLEDYLARRGEELLRRDRERLQLAQEKLQTSLPGLTERDRSRLAALDLRISRTPERVLEEKRHRLQLLLGRYEALSPLHRLNQGYAWTETEDHRHIREAAQVLPGDRIRLLFRDGEVLARAEETRLQTPDYMREKESIQEIRQDG